MPAIEAVINTFLAALYTLGGWLDTPIANAQILSIIQGGLAVLMLQISFMSFRRRRKVATLSLVSTGVWLFGLAFSTYAQYYPPLTLKWLIGLSGIVMMAYLLARPRVAIEPTPTSSPQGVPTVPLPALRGSFDLAESVIAMLKRHGVQLTEREIEAIRADPARGDFMLLGWRQGREK